MIYMYRKNPTAGKRESDLGIKIYMESTCLQSIQGIYRSVNVENPCLTPKFIQCSVLL